MFATPFVRMEVSNKENSTSTATMGRTALLYSSMLDKNERNEDIQYILRETTHALWIVSALTSLSPTAPIFPSSTSFSSIFIVDSIGVLGSTLAH